MNIVLLGLPGAGKGTQAEKIVDELGIVHISTGDMFREAVLNKTQLGVEAKAFMDEGKLVPDSVTIGIVQERVSDMDCKRGFILDGFPRTVPQAISLDDIMANLGSKLSFALYIDASPDLLLRRLTGRRICKCCGKTYHLMYSPPKQPGTCDKCGGKLYQRDDDTEDTVRERLKVNLTQTNSLLDFYNEQEKLLTVNGNRAIDEVSESILKLIRSNL